MTKLLPLLLAILLVYLLVKYITTLPKKQRKATIIKYAVYGIIGLLIIAVFTGRIHWLGAVLAGALGLLKVGASTLMRTLPFLGFLRHNNVLNNPVFRTKNIEIVVDLKTGSFSGRVLTGEFANRDISSLSELEFDTLEKQLENTDTRAYYLLRVIRQRMNGTKYQNTDNGHQPIIDAPSVEEAQLILGLSPPYDKKTVDTAYKRLMQKLHPDRGGNDYLASRVNIARDIVLKHLKK